MGELAVFGVVTRPRARALGLVCCLATCGAIASACSGGKNERSAAHHTTAPAATSGLTLLRLASRDAIDQRSVRVNIRRAGGGVTYSYSQQKDITVGGDRQVTHLGSMRAVEVKFGNRAYLFRKRRGDDRILRPSKVETSSLGGPVGTNRLG
jgi:hypothetical protein